MSKLVYAINVTLDGFANHEAAVADDQLHDFYTALLRSADAVLWGRVIYELLASYWPTAPDNPASTRSEIAFANVINRIPKYVFSKTLEKVDWENAQLVKGDAVEEVLKLKSKPGKDLLIGGLSFTSTFVDLGLIDEYWLLIQPVFAGKGKPLFKGLHQRVPLKLIDTQTFHSGVVALHFSSLKRGLS
jgi:dihydrofolate reductase